MPVTVGIVGCGALGAALARRLLLCGFPVVVWNRTASRATHIARQGAALARDAADCAARSQVVLLCVPGEYWDIVVSGREGLIGGARPATILVGCGSATPAQCNAMASTWATTGGWCDGALVGDIAQVDRGAAMLLAGGAAPDVERIQPVLQAMADPVLVMGGNGDGHAVRERLLAQDAAITSAWEAAMDGATPAQAKAMAAAQTVAARRAIERLAERPVAVPSTGRTVKPVKAVTVGLPLPELPPAILPEVPALAAEQVRSSPIATPASWSLPTTIQPAVFARPVRPDTSTQPGTATIARATTEATPRAKAVTIATAPPPAPFAFPEPSIQGAPAAPTDDDLHGPRPIPPSADWERTGADWQRRRRDHHRMVAMASAALVGGILGMVGGMPGLIAGLLVGGGGAILIAWLRLSHLSGAALVGLLTAIALFTLAGPIAAFIGALGGCVLGVVMAFWVQGMD